MGPDGPARNKEKAMEKLWISQDVWVDAECREVLVDTGTGDGRVLLCRAPDQKNEVHYYLEGEVVVTCSDETFKAEAGSLAFLPKGVPHALRFGDATRGRWLWISPENRDELLREAGVPTSEPEPAEDEIDMERVIGIFEKHGMRFLEDVAH
jgi:mannose-6-phosphate isomerase-like protein (cupin superfamily)